MKDCQKPKGIRLWNYFQYLEIIAVPSIFSALLFGSSFFFSLGESFPSKFFLVLFFKLHEIILMDFLEVKDELKVKVIFCEHDRVSVGNFAAHAWLAHPHFVVAGHLLAEFILPLDLEIIQLSHQHAAAYQHQNGEDVDSIAVAWLTHSGLVV